MIGGDDDRVCADHGIPADREIPMSIEDAIRTDIAVRLNFDGAAISSENDTIGNGDPRSDENTSAVRMTVGVLLDHRTLGNIGGGGNPDSRRRVQLRQADPVANPGEERAFGSHGSGLRR